MKTHFTVWIVARADAPSWECLFEVAAGVRYSLERLGYGATLCAGSVPYEFDPEKSRLIVFNAHKLGDFELPAGAIIFNAEQVQPGWYSEPFWNRYLQVLRHHRVWDYSGLNIERLAAHHVPRVTLCCVGYYPELSNISPVEEDLDVLFVGSLNERRARLLENIASHRIHVRVLSGVYGKERNDWIGRAKIVLNLHYYPSPIWEIFRVSHLLANKKCVITEDGGADPALEQFARESCIYVPAADLAKTCQQFLAHDGFRRTAAENGFRVFSQTTDQVAEVRRALEESP